MILVDLNQVLIANVMQQINSNENPLKSKSLDESLVRHMVLNTLRSYIKNFKDKYGDMVVCCDSKKYWRRDYFSFYKSGRKKSRESSGLDWNSFFNAFDNIRAELKDYFPYKIIDVEGAEADDVIAVLCGKYSPHEEILIISSDKDFLQLQKYKNVFQYSPIMKKFIKCDDPLAYIREHILRGDKGDGIPNFLSPDNCFALGERQKVLSAKKMSEWMIMSHDEFLRQANDDMSRGYLRNQHLINLDFIPDNIKTNIVAAYELPAKGSKQKLMNYFIEKRLTNLIETLTEF